MTLERRAAGSRVLGLRFTAYAAPHLDDTGELSVNGAAGTLIENSTFDHSSGAGLKISGPRMVVRRSTIRDNAGEGMQGNRTDDALVTGNLFLRNNTAGFKVWDCGASCTVAGYKAAHTKRLTVTDNAFVDNASNGFWCDLGCTAAVVRGNVVRGGYDGIFYEVSSGAVIEDNVVSGADKGIRVSGSDHVVVVGNTLVDNTWQLTVLDDRRPASSDAYSLAQGLRWDTRGLVVERNVLLGGPRTAKVLALNATSQVLRPRCSGRHATTSSRAPRCWRGATGSGRAATCPPSLRGAGRRASPSAEPGGFPPGPAAGLTREGSASRRGPGMRACDAGTPPACSATSRIRPASRVSSSSSAAASASSSPRCSASSPTARSCASGSARRSRGARARPPRRRPAASRRPAARSRSRSCRTA